MTSGIASTPVSDRVSFVVVEDRGIRPGDERTRRRAVLAVDLGEERLSEIRELGNSSRAVNQ